MKIKIKYFTILSILSIITFSCNWDDTNYELLTNAPESGAPYYIQFQNASKSLETGVSTSGELVEIETTISVTILGTPLSEDLPIALSIDPSSTIESSMYTLSSNSIIIKAGEITGSISYTSIAENMPIGEHLTLVMNLDMGEQNATTGTQLNYDLLRINFCPWTVDEMVGTYTGEDTDPYNGGTMTGAKFEVFKVDDTHIAVSGITQSLFASWGETVTSGDRVILEYQSNGGFTAENQFLSGTDNTWLYYFGLLSDQKIKWDGCEKTITIEYGFHWDDAYEDSMPGLSVMNKD